MGLNMNIPRSKSLGYKGYIFSREINGNFIPQRVQNLVIKEFCNKKNFFFKLSSTEYIMNDCFYMLKALLKESKSIDGVVFYSIDMLPKNKKLRLSLLTNFIKKKKKVFFALEEISINTQKELEKLETLLCIRLDSMRYDFIKKNRNFFKDYLN